MRFANEGELEGYVRSLIEKHVTRKNPHIYTLKNKKAVDIVVCRDEIVPAVFFIEVKYHRANERLGFGSLKGAGFQPEIVIRQPMYFEQCLRWVLASEMHAEKGVLFVPSSTIRQYAAGGSVGEKVNNIRREIFDEVPMLQERKLISAFREWFGLSAHKRELKATRHT